MPVIFSSALVLISDAVADYPALIAGLLPGVEAIVIDSHRDGVEQITQALAAKPYTHISILAHGRPGYLEIGDRPLSLDTLEDYAPALSQWFSAPASLSIYGCHVAAGDAGAEFLEKLHHLTGAAIAASPQSVGSSALGGTWDLEVRYGTGNSAPLFIEPTVLSQYAGILPATITTITSITANGNYRVGSPTINIRINFSELVILTGGNLVLTLDSGATVIIPPFSGAVANGLYTVAAGENSADLNVTGITLSGGTFKNSGGVDVDLTVPTSTNLANNKAIVIDTTAPTVTLSTLAAADVNGMFAVTATFSEAVTTFSATDLIVGNGTVSGFSGSGTTYTFNVTPSSSGTVTIDVAAGAAPDPANNDNIAAATLTRNADLTPPSVVLSTSPTTTHVNGAFVVTATFNESVSNFDISDVSVSNGSVSLFSGSGNSYTFTVTPMTNGVVTVNVPSAAAQDMANNNNIAAVPLTRTADLVPPTVALTSAAPSNVNGAFTVTATFGEPVTNFIATDIVVGNGSVTAFSGSSNIYTFTVTPTTSGTVTVDIPANVAQDIASSGNTAATTLTRNADLIAPTVVLASAAPTNVNGLFNVTATFSEIVNNFVASDVSLFNGTLSNFTAVSGTTYTFDVTPTASGVVNININSNVAQDVANNGNTAAAGLTFNADLTPPALVWTSSALPNVNGTFAVTANFTEIVTGFTAGDIVVSNGAVSNFSGSGSTYTFDITPSSSGAITVNVPASAAQDVAGNNNTASPTFTRNADLVAPTVSLSSAAPANVNGAFSVTATFSEAVTNFIASDITVTNGTVSGFSSSSATTYTFNVIPTTSGTVTVDIAASMAQDVAGNNNTAATALTRLADLVAPTVALSTLAPANVKGLFSVTATFSEAVTNFIASDITIANGTVSNFSGSGTTYTFDVNPTTSGTVNVNVSANVAQDIANNNNTEATTLSVSADLVLPTVALTSAAPTNVNGLFSVTATFSETVSGFIATDVTVTNGTVSNFSGSGTTYTFDVTPSSSGFVVVDIAANSAIDIATNGNVAAPSLVRNADLIAPTIALTSASPSNVNGAFRVRATFSEVVSNFTVGDIAAVNGTISNFSVVSDSIYEFDVTPVTDGVITIDVAANVAQDIAGNSNTAALTLNRSADLTVPTVALSSAAPTNVNGLFSVTATFSEAVSNFLIGDVAVTNGVVSNFVAVSGSLYTFDITPSASGTVTVNVAAGVAQDIANNNNPAAAALTREADIVVPTVVLTSASPANVNGMFSVTATFSETVFNFDGSDVAIANGTLSNFSGTGAVYTFDVTPLSDGAIAIDIAAGAAQDIANNNNTTALTLNRDADITAPTVVLSSGSPTNVNGVFSVTATFSESVSNFVVGDITVANGTVSNLVDSGSTYTFDVTPTSDGNVTVDIAANIAQDIANNGNSAATQLTRNADITVPTVSLTSASLPDVNGLFSVTATFSEAVSNFVVGDVIPGNGIISNFTAVSSTLYTFDVTPIASGTVTVDVGAGAAQDIANNNSIAASLTRMADLVAPTVILSSTAPTFVNGLFNVTVTFDEPILNLDASDFTLSNGSISNFIGTGANYSFDITPIADGVVTVDLVANVAQDAAGNTNTAANQLNRTADLVIPTVSLTSSAPPEVNSLFSVQATFSEAVSNFTAAGVTVTNGTVSNFAGSGTTYTFDITPIGTGTLTINVPAGVAQDIANNNNAAAIPLTRVSDIESPTAVLTSAAAASVGATFSVTATFSEPVVNFIDTDLTVTNGFVTNFNGSGNVYTFDVTPVASGNLTVDIAAGVTQDTAGNLNTAALTFTRIVDFTPPTVVLTSNAPVDVNDVFSVTATFDEAMIDFTASDITVTNGTVSGFSGSGTTYTFNVTPGASGTVTVDIADSVATDIAGNPNDPALSLSRNIDKTPPTSSTIAPILVAASDTGASNQDAITNNTLPTFTGSGEVGGMVQIFAGQTLLGSAAIAPDGQWSFTPSTPLKDGKYNITFTVTDVAGNISPASPPLALTIDTVSSNLLKVEITPDVRETNADGITIQFNEAVSNFDLTDLFLTLNDRPLALTGATLTTQDNITWTLNLGSQTAADGTYKLTLNKGNITDVAGNPLAGDGQESWITGRTGTPLPLIDFGGRTKGDRKGITRKGTPKNDRLLGTPRNDDMRGGKGDDTLIGGFGIPLYGLDRLLGDEGNDNLIGGNDSDWLDGGKGRDRVSGGDGRDVVMGGADDDKLLGGRQDDVLIGGMGKDFLTGGSGRDTFTFNNLVEGVDTIRDFSPTEDLIDLRQIFAKLPAGASAFARYRQFVKLEVSGNDVKVNIIADGTAKGDATTLAIVQNTSLNAIGSRNFLIQ